MKKTMKKVLVLAVMAAMVASVMMLAGCGKKDDAKTDLDYIEDKGKVVVGLDDTFAPMGFRDKDNNIVGFDIDLAKATFKEMGLEVEFKAIDWTAKEAELSSKKIDCIWNGLSVTPDRIENLSLSKRYCANRELVMSLDKNINIKDPKELKNYKIATQADSAAADDIKAHELYEEFKDNVTEYKTYDQALLDMKAGRVDVVVIDEVYATYNNENKEKLYESEFNFGSDDYAVGFRKEDTKLTEKFNEALKAVIDSGEAEKISKNWFKRNLVIYEDI
jgi:polar amino acid transport system substrate-binding protein